MSSQIKTGLLLGLLTLLLMMLGQAMGGRGGMTLALGLALALNFASYWFSDKIVLSMYGARELSPDDAPAVRAILEDLAQRAGLPCPKLYLVPQEAPNAFATGRDPAHAAVAVTEGILRLLSPEELRGVLSHEMAHIAHRDILIQSVAATLGGAIMYAANLLKWGAIFGSLVSDREDGEGSLAGGILVALFAPLAAMLVQMAISRSREFLADEGGARISRAPLSLAGALGKLDSYAKQIPMQANPATEGMFIVSPLSGSWVAGLFSTHPPVQERIARLRAMSGKL